MQQQLEHSIDTDKEGKAELKKLILDIRNWYYYLLSKWYIILIVAGLGAAAGFIYVLTKKTQYVATTSFVLETGGSGGGASPYAGIASAFGVSLGDGGGGLFEGENILELYKSRRMITEALLSTATFNGQEKLLIDRYVEFNNLKEKLKQRPDFKNLRFRTDNKYATEQEQLAYDGLVSGIVADINNKYLKVDKKDKKLNIIEITVSSPDELFSKNFNEQIVAKVNEFYLNTKTKKGLENVAVLQDKVDSVRGVLSGAISRGAAVADATPNQNPTRMAQRIVPVQNARVNAEISQGSLATLIQNLEMSKISLQKETPLIQIVDAPILPLDKKNVSKLKILLIGGLAGCFLALAYLIIRRTIREALR